MVGDLFFLSQWTASKNAAFQNLSVCLADREQGLKVTAAQQGAQLRGQVSRLAGYQMGCCFRCVYRYTFSMSFSSTASQPATAHQSKDQRPAGPRPGAEAGKHRPLVEAQGPCPALTGYLVMCPWSRLDCPHPCKPGREIKEVRREQGRRRPGLRGGAHSVLGAIELLSLLSRPPKKPLTWVLEVFFRRRSAASLALTRYRSRLAGGAPRSSSSEGDGCSLPEDRRSYALARRQRRVEQA